MKGIAIVIVNHNSGHALYLAVHAVLKYCEAPEIIVVDNASTDHGLKMIRSLGEKIKLISQTQNIGFSRAVNIGIRHVTKEYVLILNPDCIVKENTIMGALECLLDNSVNGMAGVIIENVDGSIQKSCRRRIPTPESSFAEIFNRFPGIDKKAGFIIQANKGGKGCKEVEAISGAFMLARKSALLEAGAMDEDYFLHCEDLDLFKRITDHGWKIVLNDSVSAMHYQGLSGRDKPYRVEWHKHVGMVRFYLKHYRYNHNFGIHVLVMMGIATHLLGSFIKTGFSRTLGHFGAKTYKSLTVPRWLLEKEGAYGDELSGKLLGKNVLVLGGTGYLGRQVINRLIQHDCTITSIQRRNTKETRVENVKYIDIDITKSKELARVIDGNQVIIYLASYGKGEHDYDQHHAVSVGGIQNIIEHIRNSGVKIEQFVFISSAKVYGDYENHDCYKEESRCRPQSAYGKTKLEAERLLQKAAQDDLLNYTILRIPLLYGNNDRSGLCRFVQMCWKGWIPPIPRIDDKKSMLHIENAVMAILQVLLNPHAENKIYNVTDGIDYSIYDIYREIYIRKYGVVPRIRLPFSLYRGIAAVGDVLVKLGVKRVPYNSKIATRLFGNLCLDDSRIRKETGYASLRNVYLELDALIRDCT